MSTQNPQRGKQLHQHRCRHLPGGYPQHQAASGFQAWMWLHNFEVNWEEKADWEVKQEAGVKSWESKANYWGERIEEIGCKGPIHGGSFQETRAKVSREQSQSWRRKGRIQSVKAKPRWKVNATPHPCPRHVRPWNHSLCCRHVETAFKDVNKDPIERGLQPPCLRSWWCSRWYGL